MYELYDEEIGGQIFASVHDDTGACLWKTNISEISTAEVYIDEINVESYGSEWYLSVGDTLLTIADDGNVTLP